MRPVSFNKINYLDSPPKLLAISDRAICICAYEGSKSECRVVSRAPTTKSSPESRFIRKSTPRILRSEADGMPRLARSLTVFRQKRIDSSIHARAARGSLRRRSERHGRRKTAVRARTAVSPPANCGFLRSQPERRGPRRVAALEVMPMGFREFRPSPECLHRKALSCSYQNRLPWRPYPPRLFWSGVAPSE